MIIVPKVDENWEPVDGPIMDALAQSHVFEIQLLSKDICTAFLKATQVLDKIQSKVRLTEVILHMPLGLHELEYAAANSYLRSQVYELFFRTHSYGLHHGIRFHVLFHIPDSMEKFIGFGGMELLYSLLASQLNTCVLLENSTRAITLDKDKPLALEKLFETFEHPKLGICWDICHFQSSENAYDRVYSLTSRQIENIRSVHFSCTLNHDGYRQKSTHGQPHPTLEMLQEDLQYMRSKGVDPEKVWMVLEVAEVDYVKRTGLVHELDLFSQLNN